jgi:hypothetical protein
MWLTACFYLVKHEWNPVSISRVWCHDVYRDNFNCSFYEIFTFKFLLPSRLSKDSSQIKLFSLWQCFIVENKIVAIFVDIIEYKLSNYNLINYCTAGLHKVLLKLITGHIKICQFSLIINIFLSPTYISSNIYCNLLANIDMQFVYGDFKRVK